MKPAQKKRLMASAPVPNSGAHPEPDDAVASIAAAASAPHKAPDLRSGQTPDAAPGAGDARDSVGLGENCPVNPLGFRLQRNYFLDAAGQLIELGTEFRKGEVMMLFGEQQNWLKWRWPVKKEVLNTFTGEKEWITVGWDQKEAQEGLIVACAKAGLFDAMNKERGRGAHRGDDDELVLHCGTQILIGGKRGTRGNVLKPAWSKTGIIAGYVYPRLPALDFPADIPAPDDVAKRVLAHLSSWAWKKKGVYDYLLLCWLAAAQVGGALPHRPHAWITGPSGAGKSALQKFLRVLMGEWVVTTEDATEAGLRQTLDKDTLAVMFDEIEPDAHNGDVHQKIVKLARTSATGGSSVRGAQDHKAKQFVSRSCFLFSSIHHHELDTQDRNRIAVLHLSKFPNKASAPQLPKDWKTWGPMLRRRIVEQWHRFDATLAVYQAYMLECGLSGREQDTYGNLLAAGDLLFWDDVPGEADGEDGDRHIALVDMLGDTLDTARSEAESMTERSIKYLASRQLPAEAGKAQRTVGQWISERLIDIIKRTEDRKAREKLASFGMRVVQLDEDHDKGNGQGGLTEGYLLDRLYLAVANKTNSGMLDLFKGSVGRDGQWTQHFAALDGVIVNKKSRFAGGPPEGCVLVPLDEFVDIEAVRVEAARPARSLDDPNG